MNTEKTNIESVLAENGMYAFFPKGTSMTPLIIQGRDSVIVERKKERLKKYDIALYKRSDGTYVLHRVVRVKKDSYTMCGDNQYHYEYGVKEDSVLGVLVSLFKDGKEVDLNGKEYRRYAFKTVFLQPIKRTAHKLLGR